MQSARGVVWLGVALAALGGCARLDLSDTALLRCTTNEACPSSWRCAATIERCVPEGGDDLLGPQLQTSTLQVDDGPLTAGTIVGPGATAVWHFTVDEAVFSAPTAVLVSDLDVPSLPMAVLLDDDAAGYSMEFRVSSDAGTAVLTPVVSLVDRVGNPSLVELLSLPIDTVAPVAAGITLTPADFAIDDTVAVAIDALDDHAIAACIKAVDDDATDAAAIVASCIDSDFGALARTVTLPAGNGEKRIVAVVRDEAGNVAAPLEARVVRLEGGTVESTVTLTRPAGQQEVKPGDTIDVDVVLTPGAEPTATRLFVDGTARDVVVGFASVASDRVEGSFVVPADVVDRSTLELQVTASFLGRDSDPDQSRSDTITVDAIAPAIDLAALSLAVSDRTVHIDVRQLRPDTIQHFLIDGDLDSGGGTVDFATSIDVVLAETAESDALDAIKVRDVRLRAVDGAGNVSDEDTLRFRLLPDAALGSLELRNGERQVVSGLKTRTRDPVAFGGTVEDSAALLVAGSAQLVYLNDDGVVVCQQAAPSLGLEQGVFVGSTRTTVCAEGVAASVHLEVQIAFAGGLPTVLSSADLFIDNDVPTVTALAFVPVGDQRNNTTNSTSVQVTLEASDAHGATVAFSGDVIDDGVVSVASAIDGQRTFDLTLVSLNGGAVATRTIIAELEDEVGNRTLRVLNLVVDTVAPAPPRIGEARVLESAAAPNDPLFTTTANAVELVVQSPVIDSADRLLVLVDDDAVAVAPVEVRGPNNRFTLPAGTGRVSLVSVDDAGNRSSGNPVITVPRLVVSALPTHPFGPTPSTFTITSSVTAGSLGVSLPAALSVRIGAATASCVPNPAAVDTEVQCSVVLAAGQAPEGRVGDVGAAVIRVDLTAPRVVATSGTATIVDTTPPVLSSERDILDVVAVGRGAADLVVGDADAVVDFAGSTRVGDLFAPTVAVTTGATRHDGTAAADGSFTIDVGDFGDDVGSADVIVTATDAAGNVGVPVTLFNDVRRPGVVVTLSAARFRGGEIGVDVVVSDASAVAPPQVTIGGAAATVTSLSSTHFAAALAVAVPVVNGARSVVVDVVDAAGNTQRVTRSVTVDGVAPTITPRVAARTNQARVEADVADASGSVARVDVEVRDTDGNGIAFSGALSRVSGNTFATAVTGLSDGHTYSATFSAVDDVGNASSAGAVFVFDTTPPQVRLTVDNSDPYETRVPFSVEVVGDVDLSTLECRIDSTRSDRFGSCDNATFGVSSGVLVVAPGAHLLAVRAHDAAGNQSASDEVVFTVRARRTLAGGDGVWCAIDDDDNSMQCWGNQHGELDAGGIAGPVGPRAMPPEAAFIQHRWRKVAVRKGTICALDTNNFGVFCWGDNSNARALRSVPVAGLPSFGAVTEVPMVAGQTDVALAGNFLDIALFDEGGCVIDATHQLQCWGKSLFNTFQEPQATLQPVGFDRFDTVVAAGRVVCASSFAGDAACFGESSRGQTLTNTTTPGAIDVSVASDVGDISTGGGHSCAIRRQDRAVICAGNDDAGAVSGFEAVGAAPGAVHTSQLGVAVRVVAAGDRTCALGVDGRVRCQGELAHGEIAASGRIVQPAFGVVPVIDGEYDDVTADDGTICGIERGTARVLCVGENGGGQIDLQGFTPAEPFTGTQLPSSVRRLAMVGRTVCASLNNGQRFCMGDNPRNRWIVDGRFFRFTSDVLTEVFTTNTGADDQLALADDYACTVRRDTFTAASGLVCVGDPSAPLARTASRFEALETSTVITLPSFTVRSIALADTFGCVAGDSDVSCWGRLPTTGQTTVAPVLVSVGGPVGQIDELAVGDEHVCQRTSTGVQCLGSNSASQLGSAGGNTATLRSITATAGGVSLNDGAFGFSPRRIAARGATTCTTTSTGPACWGSNAGGLAGAAAGFFGGPAAFPSVPVPRKVDNWDAQTGSCTASDVDVGRELACATCGNRGIFCWGGREPIANDPDFLLQVDDDFGYSEVAVSDDGVVCAVQFGSTVRCFGDLSFGLSDTGNGFRETATEVVLP